MLLVSARPYVKLPENTVVVEGETLILDCTGTGYPSPTILWKIGKFPNGFLPMTLNILII